MIQKLHQLVALLSDTSAFRKNLPEALTAISHNFGANNVLLFEFAPVYLETPHLLVERILEMPSTGSPQDHPIPDPLAEMHFPVGRIEKWFEELRGLPTHLSFLKEIDDNICTNEVICGTFKGLVEVSDNTDMAALIDMLNIIEKSYALFPLVREERIFGCLFFLFTKENHPWDCNGVQFACSGANLITNLLKQQHTENKLELERQILLNVHQQKTTEILLEEGEALLKAVLDAMPDIKLHVKRDGTILEVYSSSQTVEEQIFFDKDIKGKKLTELMPVFTAKGLLFNVEAAINNQTLQTFEYLNTVAEETYYFEARINQVNEGEAIIILRDITSVKKTENDLNEQIYKHDQNVRELKKYIESNLQLENFAYIASHDLREPLRTMRMFSQFLKKK
ncbi:MAG: hypothetical protein AAGJ93_05715, partial [Bacteroidota bacterium]